MIINILIINNNEMVINMNENSYLENKTNVKCCNLGWLLIF
jgi:hypothetical protein